MPMLSTDALLCNATVEVLVFVLLSYSDGIPAEIAEVVLPGLYATLIIIIAILHCACAAS